jgi:uncharacterized protein
MFQVILEDEEKLKQAKFFLTGFQGLGSVGYIAIKHIIDELKATRVGVLKSKAAPPFIYLEKESIVLPFELYSHNNILIFLPRLPPYRHTETEFAESLIEWVMNVGHIELAILVGGVDQNLKTEDDSDVKYVPTKSFPRSDKIDLAENMLSSGLMIQGPLAVMLGNLDLKKFPALGILAFADRERPDPKGAAAAIEIINKLINIECSVQELVSSDDVFDSEIKKFPTNDELDNRGPPETYT